MSHVHRFSNAGASNPPIASELRRRRFLVRRDHRPDVGKDVRAGVLLVVRLEQGPGVVRRVVERLGRLG